MLDRLIDYVPTLSDEDLSRSTIQDIAICMAWHESFAEDPGVQKLYQALPGVVDRWAGCVHAAGQATQGRRHQWVLRELVDTLQAGNAAALKRDEADLLYWVRELGKRAEGSGLFERLESLLSLHAGTVSKMREALPLAPGLPRISERLHFVTAEDIENAKSREINTFAGINVTSRGPVFTHRGHLRVLESVPEDCTLVVEDGSCSVEGFVMGRVAASRDCEVRENISGTVVVREGNVRTRNIINRAYIVSKWGSVYCYDAQDPELVFAGSEIFVESGAVRGRFVAPRITVKGAAAGGEYHCAARLSADSFLRGESQPLTIVLRRSVSCKDYGEAPGEEVLRTVSRAIRLRNQLSDLTEGLRFAERQASQCADSAMLYLLGGETNPRVVDRVKAAESRLSGLDQLIRETATLARYAEDRLQGLVDTSDGSSKDLPAEPAGETAPVSSPDEPETGGALDRVDSDLSREFEVLNQIWRKLTAAGLERKVAIALLMRLRVMLSERAAEREELLNGIDNWQTKLVALLKDKGVDRRRGGLRGRMRMLQKLLGVARLRPYNDPIAQRLQSAFMRVILRTLSNRAEEVKRFQEFVAEARKEFNEVTPVLRKKHHIIIEEEGYGATQGPRVVGKFEAGVRIAADTFLLEAANPTQEACFVTTDSGDEEAVYERIPPGFVRKLD